VVRVVDDHQLAVRGLDLVDAGAVSAGRHAVSHDATRARSLSHAPDAEDLGGFTARHLLEEAVLDVVLGDDGLRQSAVLLEREHGEASAVREAGERQACYQRRQLRTRARTHATSGAKEGWLRVVWIVPPWCCERVSEVGSGDVAGGVV